MLGLVSPLRKRSLRGYLYVNDKGSSGAFKPRKEREGIGQKIFLHEILEAKSRNVKKSSVLISSFIEGKP